MCNNNQEPNNPLFRVIGGPHCKCCNEMFDKMMRDAPPPKIRPATKEDYEKWGIRLPKDRVLPGMSQ